MQMLSKKNIQISIGLIVMAIAMISLYLGNLYEQSYMRLISVMQVKATGALLFGFSKAHPQHKAKFVLFWLGITAMFLIALLYMGLDCYMAQFRYWHPNRYPHIVIIFALLAAAGVAYMMFIIYKDYVELTLGTLEAVPETKEPQSYESNLQNITLSLESKA